MGMPEGRALCKRVILIHGNRLRLSQSPPLLPALLILALRIVTRA
jgi:hypothetical protein